MQPLTLTLFRCVVPLLLTAVCASVSAQEVERDLLCVPVAQDGAPVPNLRRGGGNMSLPFFDDFASPTFAGEEGPIELVRWSDGSARRTATYAMNAPTVGAFMA